MVTKNNPYKSKFLFIFHTTVRSSLAFPDFNSKKTLRRLYELHY